MSIRIVIEREPVSWMAPIRSKNRFFSPRSDERHITQLEIREQYKGHPIESYVHIFFLFSFKYPKNTSKKRLEAMKHREIIPTKKDTSNMVKFYEDCLKGIVIKDDRQTAAIVAEKFYGEEDSIRIIVNHYEYVNHEKLCENNN